MHVVLVGNPLDGIAVFGPFNTYDEALDWAEGNANDGEWWITKLCLAGSA
jgi:hypothetical protein